MNQSEFEQLTIGQRIVHKTEKKPYKIIAEYQGVYIATKHLFGKEFYVVLDTNQNICGHSELMNFPRGLEGSKDYAQELERYADGEWKISQRGIGKINENWDLWGETN